MNGPKFPETWKPETWNTLEILNDIKNLNGSKYVLNFLNLVVSEWFEYVELCGSSYGIIIRRKQEFLCECCSKLHI